MTHESSPAPVEAPASAPVSASASASVSASGSASRRVVLDTDFGNGERFLAAWSNADMPQRDPAPCAPLYYLAVTPRLPPPSQIADLRLRAQWPLNVPGFHRIVLDDGRVTLDLLVGALDAVLPQIDARIDDFHIAPCAPSLARALAKLAAPGATLRAYTPDEALVWALTAAGFACQAVDGSDDVSAVYRSLYQSRARQRGATSSAMLAPAAPPTPLAPAALPASSAPVASPAPAAPPATLADRRPSALPIAPSQPVRRAIVIGAGLAGSSACHRLCANGWDVTLIEKHAQPAQEASGNLAGIFMPLLSKDDNIPTRLSRAAYLFALREWRRLGGVGKAFDGADCGVLQLARDAAHAKVQQDVVAAWDYPKEYVRWLEADAAGDLLGGPTPHGGWLFEQGGWARPASLCGAMLAACGARLRRVFCAQALELQRDGAEWRVLDADGMVLAQAPTVILANGNGAVNTAQAAQLPLSSLRGQVTHLTAGAPLHPPQLPLVVCREAYVTPAANGIVSAGATYDNDDDPALRASSQFENLTRLAEIVPGAHVAALAAHAPLAGRVGFRCAAPDRLPLCGALPDYDAAGRLEHLRDVPRHPGLYGLLGYASRGLIWAPLMAELLVCQLENAPPPLEASLVAALDPGRFLLKQRRRSQ
jgi:tRNA 5-methylaminomethyl-2-thiouridine biosynthesis bifunctional protein